MEAMAQAKRERVGWIGTGVMGASMCGHLLDHGYPVNVFNRTRSRADPLVERGARWCENPAAVAADAGGARTRPAPRATPTWS
jgi:3-hydroxyisobutyrate dehydrogenase